MTFKTCFSLLIDWPLKGFSDIPLNFLHMLFILFTTPTKLRRIRWRIKETLTPSYNLLCNCIQSKILRKEKYYKCQLLISIRYQECIKRIHYAIASTFSFMLYSTGSECRNNVSAGVLTTIIGLLLIFCYLLCTIPQTR